MFASLFVLAVTAGCAGPATKSDVPYSQSLVGEWVGHWRGKQSYLATGQIRYNFTKVELLRDGRYLVTGKVFWTSTQGGQEQPAGCNVNGFRLECGKETFFIVEGDIMRGEWNGSHEGMTIELRKR
jgi:hypothetical protein